MEGLRSPRGCTLDTSFYQATPDPITGCYSKIVPSGAFASSVGGASDYARILPRTRTSAMVTAGMRKVPVDWAAPFNNNGYLRTLQPSGALSFRGRWAAGDTFSFIMSDFGYVSHPYTIQPEDIKDTPAETNENLAQILRTILNNNTAFDLILNFGKVSVNRLNWATFPILSRTNEIYAYSVNFTSANGALVAVTDSMLDGNALVGIIDRVDTLENALIMKEAVPFIIPKGTLIGLVESNPADYGMINPTQPLDLMHDTIVPCFVSASVWIQRLPHWDEFLHRQFPEIVAASKVGRVF